MNQSVKILLSNDDGWQAPGIQTLFERLRQQAGVERVVMIAPETNRSAASNALTLRNPLRLHAVGPDQYAVNGTPSDCVHLGTNGALGDFRPDLVIAGINDGANMGDDVLYSGTVAAAMEGRFMGLPAIAVSLVEPDADSAERHYETAAHWTVRIVCHLSRLAEQENVVLNVNVPNRPVENIQGVRITRLGRRHQSEPVICDRDPRGQPIYWVGPVGPAADEGEGTDFHAVAAGHVSITPLTMDMTHHALRPVLGQWLETVGLDGHV